MNAVSLDAFYQSSAAKYFTHDEKYNHCKGIYTKFINKGYSYEEIDVNDIAVALNYYDDTVKRNAADHSPKEMRLHSGTLKAVSIQGVCYVKRQLSKNSGQTSKTILKKQIYLKLFLFCSLNTTLSTFQVTLFLPPPSSSLFLLPLLLLLCSRFPPFLVPLPNSHVLPGLHRSWVKVDRIISLICTSLYSSKGPHPRQRLSIATAMCSQIAVAVAVDGLPTHAATDLFNLSHLNRSSLIVTMSDLAPDDQIAHQISENSDQQQPQQRPASCGGGCGCWSPYTGNLVEIAVGNCGCDWKSLSWMGPLTPSDLKAQRWACRHLPHSSPGGIETWAPGRALPEDMLKGAPRLLSLAALVAKMW